MAADWDLYAVVRSCSSVLKRDSSAVGSNRSPKGNDSGWHEDPFACLASMTNDPFPFPNPSKSGCKHEHVFTHADTTTMGTNRRMDPSFTRPDDGGSSGQHHQIQHHQQQEQPTITTSPAAPIFTFGEFGNQRQQQLQLKKRVQRQEVPRTRNRKNQNQKRTVCHVAGENLSTDQWSWRKYGQKPIKGSPNPRHYYKCSSSKGCSARKHVERSNLDPNTFIVTYTGDHIHSRPTYRNSLAGSSRRKRLLAIQKAANASSSFSSPTTPLTAPEDGAAAAANLHNAGDNGVKEGETANNVALETSTDAENDDDDDVILIPNVHVNENLFQGLGPNWPAFGGNFPSWGTGSSAAGRG